MVALRIILGLWSVVCEANSPGATGGSINPVVHGSYEGYHPQQLQQLQHQQQEAWQPQDNYYRQQHQQQEEEEEILAPLPTGWTEHIDPSSGQSYFYNSADGTTTWDRPKAQDGAEVEPKYEQQQQGNAVETSGPENDQGALTEKSETSELPVEAEDQSTLHINKSSEVTESPVSIVGAEVTDRDALTSFVRGEERSREEESWREAQCWNQPNTVNGPSSEQQKPHQEQPQGWGEQQQPRHEKPQGWSLPTEEAPRIHPGWNVNPEQINPADPGSRGSEDQKPDRFPQPVDPRLMQPQQPELQDPRQQIPPAVQKSFEQKQGEFWPTDDSPNQYHFPQVGGSPFPRITTPQVPPMAQKLAEHQQEKSWPTEERLNQHQPPPEGGTPFDRIASQPPWPDPTQPMYPTQERGPIPGRGPYPHDEQKRSQLQQQGPSIQQLPPSRWGQQLQPRGQESQQQPQLAYPQSSQQDLPPQFRPQWPENTVRQQRAPPHEGGYPHGPRPPQPIPHEGQYNRYEPQLNSPPTGQLVSQEEQSVVRESLGKTWKSILGLGTRTKEAVEAATSTVAQSAKGATETITATSSGKFVNVRDLF